MLETTRRQAAALAGATLMTLTTLGAVDQLARLDPQAVMLAAQSVQAAQTPQTPQTTVMRPRASAAPRS